LEFAYFDSKIYSIGLNIIALDHVAYHLHGEAACTSCAQAVYDV
jgi:hypothetical protein